MKNNTAIFPGSFDPFTLGHVEIVNTGLQVFQNIIIAIGVNSNKEYMFDIGKRKKFIKSVFKNNHRIIIKEYNLLTIDFCKKQNANYIIRGLRNNMDFEYEHTLALANKELDENIETIFIPANKEHLCISSSLVKEIIINRGGLEAFLPNQIIKQLY